MILITVLLTLLAIIVIAIVIVIVAAPLRISIRRQQNTQIDIEFGRYMRNVWLGCDWFNIIKLSLGKNGAVEYATPLVSWFRASKKQIAKINTKARLDRWREEDEMIEGDYFNGKSEYQQ